MELYTPLPQLLLRSFDPSCLIFLLLSSLSNTCLSIFHRYLSEIPLFHPLSYTPSTLITGGDVGEDLVVLDVHRALHLDPDRPGCSAGPRLFISCLTLSLVVESSKTAHLQMPD